MPLTRPPLTLIQPVGFNTPNNPVKTDGSRLLIMEDSKVSSDIILSSGSFDAAKGILTLVFDSGKVINVSGFLTTYSVGKGEKGDTGIPGLDGSSGLDGTNGVQGYRGMTGSQGLRGEKGEIGNDGTPGDRGEQGFKGDRGFSGASCGTGGVGGTGTHDHPISEIQAVGVMSDLTYLRGDGTWSLLPDQQAPLAHGHGISEIAISGVGDINTYLRGDGEWASLPPVEPHIHTVLDIDAYGTPDITTFLRGDGEWATLSASVNAHIHDLSEIITTGVPSLDTFLRGDGEWSALPKTDPNPHVHSVEEIYASGDLVDTTYLRGDGIWAELPPLENHFHLVEDIIASGGINDSSNYLRSDGTWANPIISTPYAYPSDFDYSDELITIRSGTPCLVSLGALGGSIRQGRLVIITSDATTSGNISLDMSAGDVFDVRLEVDTFIGIINFPDPPFQFLLRLVQGGSGNISVTWAYTFKHPNDLAPDIGTDVNDIELFVGSCVSAGRIELLKAVGPFKT